MTLQSPVRGAAIIGRGAVSSLGSDLKSLWRGIAAGECGIRPITRFSTTEFGVTTGAQVVAELEPMGLDFSAADSHAPETLCCALAVRAAREALIDANLWDHETGRAQPGIAFVFGTGLAPLSRSLHEFVSGIADECGLDGVRLAVSTACSSSTTAIGLSLDLLSTGAASIVVGGGADVLTAEVFAGFHSLGVLTPTRCAPFSRPAGTSLGEGAGFFVLADETAARSRGHKVFGVIGGYGLSCDAWHETSPDPGGSGITRAVESALLDAGVSPGAVDYVNAHGSGTLANDGAEWLGISRALGERVVPPPVSSTKGALGHAQGAAGVLEAIVSLEAMTRGVIPPTLNFFGARPHAPPDPVAGPALRSGSMQHIVSVNSGFGGANSALVLTRRSPGTRCRVRRGLALSTIARSGKLSVGDPRVEAEALAACDGGRRLDPSGRALTVAVDRALRAAKWQLNRERGDVTGLIVGQLRPSPASSRAFRSSISARGLPRLSAGAFARIVLNAPAGSCAEVHSLRGPHTVISAGAVSGLAALLLAAEHLATRNSVRAMLAAAVDEQTDDNDNLVDGAMCVVLSPASRVFDPESERPDDMSFLSGWGIAPSGAVKQAIRLAAPRGLPHDVEVIEATRGRATACGTLILLDDGAAALRARITSHVLLIADAPSVASIAVLLSHEPDARNG